MSSKKDMRIFIGLPMDDEEKRGVRRVMKILERKHWHVGWLREELWHLTMFFLGNTPIGKVRVVEEAMRYAADLTAPFTLSFKGLGAYPTLLLPRVIWLGVRGDLQALHRLRRPIGGILEENEVDYDTKPFSPHISLGRVKREASRKERMEMGKNIDKMRRLKILQEWHIKRMGLYTSDLSSEGSRYTELVKVDLKGGLSGE